MLKKRNQELYDEENEIKQWAKNEAEVVHGYISTMKELKEKLVCLEDNLKFVTISLQKKFSSSAVSCYEIQRKRKRKKEQKSKKQKQKKTEFPWSGMLESFWQTIILHGMLLTEFVPIHMERSH